MQISDRTRTIALGTVAGVALALSGTALAVSLSADGDHHGPDGARPAFAAQQSGGPGGQASGPQGFGGRQDDGGQDQQGYGGAQSAPAGPPMQSGTS